MSDEEAFLASGPWISSTNLLHSASQFAQWCNLLARPYTTHLLIFTCGSLRIFCWWSVDAVAVCIPFQRCSWKHGCARATRPIWVSFRKPYTVHTVHTGRVALDAHFKGFKLTEMDSHQQLWQCLSKLDNVPALLQVANPRDWTCRNVTNNMYELIVMLRARVHFFDSCWDRLQMHEETIKTNLLWKKKL